MIDGSDVFNLVDRYGLPLDIVVLSFRDKGYKFNVYQFIDSALDAGWKSKRIRLMLKSAYNHERSNKLINDYLEYKRSEKEIQNDRR